MLFCWISNNLRRLMYRSRSNTHTSIHTLLAAYIYDEFSNILPSKEIELKVFPNCETQQSWL